MKLLTKIAGPASLVIGLILIKAFGLKTGIGFMIISVVAIIAASAVLRELTKNRRNKSRAEVQEMLAGSTMYDFLMRNPGHLHEILRWDEGNKIFLLEMLDADDARRVKQLLAEESGSD